MGVVAALGAGEAERDGFVDDAVLVRGAAVDEGGPFAQADLVKGGGAILGVDVVAGLLILDGLAR